MIGAIEKNSLSWITGGFVSKDGKPISDETFTFHFQLKPHYVDGTVYPLSLSVDLSDDLIEEANGDNTKLFEWGLDFVAERFREAIKDSYKEKEL